MLKNFIVMATFILMFNGYIWISLFDGYRDYWIQTIDSLEDDRVRLQLKVDELANGVKDGVYQVKDTMNKRFVNRIDILESPGVKQYRFDNAKIKKANLNENYTFISDEK